MDNWRNLFIYFVTVNIDEIYDRLTSFVLRLKMCYLYEQYLQSYTLIFIHFMVKRLLQYIQLGVSELFCKETNIPNIPPGRLYEQILLVGSLMR